MGKLFGKQLTRAALTLQHSKPNDFAVSSWQRTDSPVPLLVLRVLLAACISAVWLWSLLDDGVSGYWFIYLTNWGLLLLTATTWCAVLVSLSALCVRYADREGTPWLLRLYWLLYNISVPCAFLITIFYWSILYNGQPDARDRGFWLDLSTHGGNSLVMMIELLVSRTPARLLHFYQPFGFGLWYLIFSTIYYGAGGTDENGNPYVYDVLDWSEPGAALVVVAATAAGLVALHVAVVLVALLRNRLSTACVRSKRLDLPPAPAPLSPARHV